ncbi:hypothetical protein [Methylobacterium sp. A54F]
MIPNHLSGGSPLRLTPRAAARPLRSVHLLRGLCGLAALALPVLGSAAADMVHRPATPRTGPVAAAPFPSGAAATTLRVATAAPSPR